MKVSAFKDSEVKEALKVCPDTVKAYVSALKFALEGQKTVTGKALEKIKELTNENSILRDCEGFIDAMDYWDAVEEWGNANE